MKPNFHTTGRLVWWTLVIRAMLLALLLISCTSPAQPRDVEETSQPIVDSVSTVSPPLAVSNAWPTTIIPVCWENPSQTSSDGQQRTQAAVEGSWEANSAVDFVGWEQCAPDNQGIRIKIADEGPKVTGGLGRSMDGMILNFTFTEWPCDQSDCIEDIAVHEFGHALGFAHEQNRRDAWYNCQDQHQGSDPVIDLTHFDLDSVMNYCNPNWNGDGNLSASDITGVQLVYGPPNPEVVAFSDKKNGDELDVICSISINQESIPIIDFTVDNPIVPRCPNDEVESLILKNVRAGRSFRLLDDPGGSRSDDWVVIVVKRDVTFKTIASFEASFDDDDVTVQYHRNNGLNGKVSRFEIDPPDPLEAVIDLYEEESGAENLVCSVQLNSLQTLGALDFTKDNDCANDEAQSLTLYNVPAGTVFRLFDSSSGDLHDDWVEIVTKLDLDIRTIQSFEQLVDEPDLRVTYFSHNNLNGKVSRMALATSPISGGTLVFYEDNDQKGDTVCELPTGIARTVDFTSTSDCDNDEARSLALLGVPAGVRVRIYDDPSCETSDDWTEIIVLAAVAQHVIPTFEADDDSSIVFVDYKTLGNLDGKVSCLIIEP